jgi:hypothetical protein
MNGGPNVYSVTAPHKKRVYNSFSLNHLRRYGPVCRESLPYPNIDDASRKVAAVFRASVPKDADCRGNPKFLRRLPSHSIWAKCFSRKFATKSSRIALSFAMNPAAVGADEDIS